MGNLELVQCAVPDIVQAGQFMEVTSLTRAVQCCYELRKWSDEEAAWEVGVRYCHFQRMMRPNDSRHYPADLVEEMMKKAGNIFPLQWLAWRMGGVVYPRDFMSILAGIRESLAADGKVARFALGGRR